MPPELAEDTTMAPTTTTTTTSAPATTTSNRPTTPSQTAVTDLPDSSVLCAGVALDPRRYLVKYLANQKNQPLPLSLKIKDFRRAYFLKFRPTPHFSKNHIK